MKFNYLTALIVWVIIAPLPAHAVRITRAVCLSGKCNNPIVGYIGIIIGAFFIAGALNHRIFMILNKHDNTGKVPTGKVAHILRVVLVLSGALFVFGGGALIGWWPIF